MNLAVEKGSDLMEIKTVSISSKRQITIPQKFFNQLGFGNEAECLIRDNEIILRPRREGTGGEFAEQILSDLVSQGYEGNELLKKFKEEQKKIRPAVEKLIDEADQIAANDQDDIPFTELFGSED